jgi:hypothetical protein
MKGISAATSARSLQRLDALKRTFAKCLQWIAAS